MFYIFTPKMGEMIQFDEHIFQMGGKKPPSSGYISSFLERKWSNKSG